MYIYTYIHTYNTHTNRKVSALEGTMGLLGWDEQTMMPTGAEEARGKQKAVLAGVLHESKVCVCVCVCRNCVYV
jgi:carboxypeptidase Taq